jgi:hypothetical protein
MKYLNYFLIFFLLLVLISCDSQRVDEQRFFQLYTEILEVRVAEPNVDTANFIVQELFVKYNYPEEQFKNDFMLLAETNSKDGKFAQKLDSLRTHIYNNHLKKENENIQKND